MRRAREEERGAGREGGREGGRRTCVHLRVCLECACAGVRVLARVRSCACARARACIWCVCVWVSVHLHEKARVLLASLRPRPLLPARSASEPAPVRAGPQAHARARVCAAAHRPPSQGRPSTGSRSAAHCVFSLIRRKPSTRAPRRRVESPASRFISPPAAPAARATRLGQGPPWSRTGPGNWGPAGEIARAG